jgi:hypothetical protein
MRGLFGGRGWFSRPLWIQTTAGGRRRGITLGASPCKDVSQGLKTSIYIVDEITPISKVRGSHSYVWDDSCQILSHIHHFPFPTLVSCDPTVTQTLFTIKLLRYNFQMPFVGGWRRFIPSFLPQEILFPFQTQFKKIITFYFYLLSRTQKVKISFFIFIFDHVNNLSN